MRCEVLFDLDGDFTLNELAQIGKETDASVICEIGV